MALENDGDVVHGVGFVALYAAYLEEQIDNLLFMLHVVEPYPESEQRWGVSQKIKKAKRLVSGIAFQDRDALLADLEASRGLFEWRNDVVHGRIYANFDRPDTLKSGRSNIPERIVEPAELYELANSLSAARLNVYRPMILQLPEALSGSK